MCYRYNVKEIKVALNNILSIRIITNKFSLTVIIIESLSIQKKTINSFLLMYTVYIITKWHTFIYIVLFCNHSGKGVN